MYKHRRAYVNTQEEVLQRSFKSCLNGELILQTDVRIMYMQ
jgi:hypothetical protein